MTYSPIYIFAKHTGRKDLGDQISQSLNDDELTSHSLPPEVTQAVSCVQIQINWLRQVERRRGLRVHVVNILIEPSGCHVPNRIRDPSSILLLLLIITVTRQSQFSCNARRRHGIIIKSPNLIRVLISARRINEQPIYNNKWDSSIQFSSWDVPIRTSQTTGSYCCWAPTGNGPQSTLKFICNAAVLLQ